MKASSIPMRARGFTLVEVLVALLIMSILAVMSWQGVDGIVRTRDASKTRMEATLRLNTVLSQWEQDLNAQQSSDSTVPAFSFNGASVRITRRATQGLQVVVWSLRPGLDGAQAGQTWVRWAGTPTVLADELRNTWINSQQLQGTEPGSVRAIEGLAQLQVFCYRPTDNTWTNCQSTGNNTPTVTNGQIVPGGQGNSGVRLILTFADGSGQFGSVTRDVALGPTWQ